MRSASLGTPSECDGMALVHRGATSRSAGDRRAARPDQEEFGGNEIGAGRVQHPFAEGAGEALLGAEQDQRRGASIGRRRPGRSDGSRETALPMAAAMVRA